MSRAKAERVDRTPEDPVGALLLTIPEVAAELRLDKRTVYRLLRSGQLPLQVIHIGASPRVRRRDLETYLEHLAADVVDSEAPRMAAADMWARRRRMGST
jgi:excisionase family DNA binding protein